MLLIWVQDREGFQNCWEPLRHTMIWGAAHAEYKAVWHSIFCKWWTNDFPKIIVSSQRCDCISIDFSTFIQLSIRLELTRLEMINPSLTFTSALMTWARETNMNGEPHQIFYRRSNRLFGWICTIQWNWNQYPPWKVCDKCCYSTHKMPSPGLTTRSTYDQRNSRSDRCWPVFSWRS